MALYDVLTPELFPSRSSFFFSGPRQISSKRFHFSLPCTLYHNLVQCSFFPTPKKKDLYTAFYFVSSPEMFHIAACTHRYYSLRNRIRTFFSLPNRDFSGDLKLFDELPVSPRRLSEATGGAMAPRRPNGGAVVTPWTLS